MGIIYPYGQFATKGTNTFTGDQIISGSAIGTLLPVSGTTSIVSGNVLYVQSTSGEVELADQDGVNTREIIGIALETPSTTTIKVATALGSVVSVKFATGPSGPSQIGSPVYLSSTAGEATVNIPSTGTVYKIGILLSDANVGGGRYRVLYMPNKIVDI